MRIFEDVKNRFLSRRGFTLIEFILIIFIIAITASSLFVVVQNQYSGTLDAEAQLVKSRLADAQVRAMSASQGMAWGIHFANQSSSYALFPGTSYVTASTTYYMSPHVYVCTFNSADFIFNKNTGKSTAGSDIYVILQLRSETIGSKQKMISASSNGTITVSDVSGYCD